MALTPLQARILAAVEAGHTTARTIACHADVSSTSVVMSNLRRLAAAGHVTLCSSPHGLRVDNGADFARGWDAACRLAGNEEA